MNTQSPSPRIPQLDGLRGFAVLAVIAIHYSNVGAPPIENLRGADRIYGWLQHAVALGWSGVDLFFVLSGFLIGGILLDAKESPNYYKTFYARRFYRIIPLYYLVVFGYIFVMLTIRPLLMGYLNARWELPPGPGVYLLLSFVQDVRYLSYSALAFAWLSPTWSLAVEEQFYIVAPLLIRHLTRRTLFAVMSSIVFVAPFVRMWVHFHLPNDPVSLEQTYTLMPCRADTLAMGVLAALLWRTPRFRTWLSDHTEVLYVLAGVLFAGVIVFGICFPSNLGLPMESVGYTWMGLFYTSVLLLVLQEPLSFGGTLCNSAWLRQLGRLSYCIYLIHAAVGWICQAVLHAVVAHPAVWEWALTNCVAGLLVYAFAHGSWRDIESPLLRRGHAYQY